MHNHLKSPLINRRARSAGVIRQQLNLHAYQVITAIKALIAHSIRTGAPLDEFFLGLDGKEIVLLAVFASFVFLSLVP